MSEEKGEKEGERERRSVKDDALAADVRHQGCQVRRGLKFKKITKMAQFLLSHSLKNNECFRQNFSKYTTAEEVISEKTPIFFEKKTFFLFFQKNIF